MSKAIFFSSIIFLLTSCAKVIHVTQPQNQSIEIGDPSNLQASEEINALIKPYRMQLKSEMNEVIGICAEDLVKEKPESALGNWVADLIHKKCEAYYEQPIDFAVVNYGGLRIPSLPKGEITQSSIFELMPFDNMLVVLHADGETVHKLFLRMVAYGGWPVSHQVRYSVNEEKELKEVLINDLPLDRNKMYKIALPDFVANGGDNCPFFIDKKRDELGKLFRDTILEHVKDLTKAGKQINAKKEGRYFLIKK